MNGISALIKGTQKSSLTPLRHAMRGYKKKKAICNPEGGPHQNPPMLAPSHQDSEEKMSFVYKPPLFCYSSLN